jgi:hypothetical protein
MLAMGKDTAKGMQLSIGLDVSDRWTQVLPHGRSVSPSASQLSRRLESLPHGLEAVSAPTLLLSASIG